MDSINKNQKEDNFKDLVGTEALEKVKQLAKKAGSCMMCTNMRADGPFATRPMAAEVIDDDGNFWFLSPVDSDKNKQIKNDDAIQLVFQGSAYSDFMTLYGYGTLSKDRAKIDELWDPTMKTWFTEGKDDPRIEVLRFTPVEGYYWDTKHGMAVAFVKRLAGAFIGETMDDSIEGKIKV